MTRDVAAGQTRVFDSTRRLTIDMCRDTELDRSDKQYSEPWFNVQPLEVIAPDYGKPTLSPVSIHLKSYIYIIIGHSLM